MKRIYAILLVAVALSIGSCDIESNAKYTGNYYSANTPKEQQSSPEAGQPKAQATDRVAKPGTHKAAAAVDAAGTGTGRVNY